MVSHAYNSYAMELTKPSILKQNIPLQWSNLPAEIQEMAGKTIAKLAWSDLALGETHDDYAKAQKTLTTLFLLVKRNQLFENLFFNDKPKQILTNQGFTNSSANRAFNFNELFCKDKPNQIIIDTKRRAAYYSTLRTIVARLAPFPVEKWEARLAETKDGKELFEINIAAPIPRSIERESISIFELLLDQPHAVEAVTFLINKGASINRSLLANIAEQATYPHSLDRIQRDLEIIQLFADKADPNALSFAGKQSPLSSLMFLYEKYKNPSILTTMEKVIKAGADVNGSMGDTSFLMYARDNNLSEVVEVFQSNGATPISPLSRAKKKFKRGKHFIQNRIRFYTALLRQSHRN